MDVIFFDILRRVVVADASTLLAASHLVLTATVALLVFKLVSDGRGHHGDGGGAPPGWPVVRAGLAAHGLHDIVVHGGPPPPPPILAPLLIADMSPQLLHSELMDGLAGHCTHDLNDFLQYYHGVHNYECAPFREHDFDHRGSNPHSARGKCIYCGLLYAFNVNHQRLRVYRTRR